MGRTRSCKVPPAGGGAVFDFIDAALDDVTEYRAFQEGRLTRQRYSDWMAAHGEAVVGEALNEDQRNLSTRFPLDGRQYVAEILDDLHAIGVITSVCYPEDEFGEYRDLVARCTGHGGRTTYIFPEEARLLFALAHLLAPLKSVFLGSYYGYWALWALPGIVAAGGRATLVDINPA